MTQPAHITADTINDLVRFSHNASINGGWWHDPKTGQALFDAPYIVPLKLCLVHSEISEALEAHRKGLNDDKLSLRPGIEVELADALHRIFDLAGALGLDLGGAYLEKAAYNANRADHKIENRRAGGKAY
jgi:hypothetical protein